MSQTEWGKEIESRIWDILVQTFENLDSRSFQKLKHKLKYKAPAGIKPITWRQLEEAREYEVANLIIGKYEIKRGPLLAVEILEEISERQASVKLQAELMTIGNFMHDNGENMERAVSVTSPRSAPNGVSNETYNSAAVPQGGGDHFIDKNRAALIRRMSDTNIMLVLDELLSEKILKYEQYNTVQSYRTSHEMMRKLYDYTRSWGHKQKDRLLFFISKHDNCLIMDLMGKKNRPLSS